MVAIDLIPIPPDAVDRVAALDPMSGLFAMVRSLHRETSEWELAFPGAALASGTTAGWLELPRRAALMTLDLVGVSRGGRRLYRANEHHVPNIVRSGFVRTVRS
jgi:hypothetical protein